MTLSASSSAGRLLSHPKEEQRHSLIEHLEIVGCRARLLYERSRFGDPDVAFFAGLLHDVGKINPLYQKIFCAPRRTRGESEEEAEATLLHVHSPLSAWAARHLLCNTEMSRQNIDAVCAIIYGHHSSLRRRLGRPKDLPGDDADGSKLCRTVGAAAAALPRLRAEAAGRPGFESLNWERCAERFGRRISLDIDLGEGGAAGRCLDAYLDTSFAFSCMLQADRGSFQKWEVPTFDIKTHTDTQVKKGRLASIRTEFQRAALEAFDPDAPIQVLNAPTGIGKTKVFLEMMNRYAGKVERVLYFSPLLALTEDFERKVRGALPAGQEKDVLVYTHLFAGSMEEKNAGRVSNKYVFENESFNRPFVITTTQRLLMTLYSNSARDKMKMASLANSILVIDEIQTVPKPVLANMVAVFRRMHEKMNARFILVSATVPHELKEIERVAVRDSTASEYLELTRKRLRTADELEISSIPAGKVLIMANTRRKASKILGRVRTELGGRRDVRYMSAGIRKRDRSRMLERLKDSDYVLVSTQVVEAGVDVSFTRIYREMAPLDSIVQAMGRLNREGETDDALMVVYDIDGDNTPYNSLEYEASSEIIRDVKDSVDLYGRLDSYYESVSEKNNSAKKCAADLKTLMEDRDFGDVWEKIQRLALPYSGDDTVYVPDEGEYDKVRSDLTAGNSWKWSWITATLPVRKEEIKHLLDDALYEKRVLLPRRDKLEETYDKTRGLDKWLA